MNKQAYIEVSTITQVKESQNGYEMKADGWVCFLDKKYDVTPQIGDEIKILMHWGNFTIIHGIQINGVNAFWKTLEEAEKEHRDWVEKTKVGSG